ncbi:MAG: trimethylamine methyltransferase family protein, partial [Aestuariivirga sp.]
MTAVERRGRRQSAANLPIAQLPWSQPRLTLEPLRILSDDHIETIHRQSLRVLQEIGMQVLYPEAREILAKAGAKVDDERVRIGGDIIEEALKTPPPEFTFYARNPAHNIQIGGKWIAFSPVGGPPNCSDLDRGRRPGTLEDNANFLKLSQFFNCIHTAGGGSVDALDYHASIRHLHMMRNKVHLSDKVPFTVSTGRARLFDSLEIARMARGISPEQMLREPTAYTVINTNSPLKLDNPMAMGIIEMARLNQICVVTPFTLLGAMAPVTLAGALVEQNAEALAGLALSQLSNPGAPFVYGGFTSNVDMKSGAPAFGTPEYMKACICGGQLARRYKLPYRTSSTNAANSVDAQAAYETVFSLWGAILGGGNLIQHAAGWLEGGLVGSFEKFALDVDLLQMVEEFLKPIIVDDDTMALDAMLEVGPGGHFFGAKHTLERYSTAFYQPLISDWRTFPQWTDAGSPRTEQKANALWK